MLKKYWLLPLLLLSMLSMVHTSCEKRGGPLDVTVRVEIDSLTKYKVYEDQYGNWINTVYGNMKAKVYVEGVDESNMEGLGVQLTNVSGMTLERWDYHEVMRETVSTTSNQSTLELPNIDPNWYVSSGQDYSVTAFLRPFAVIDGRMYYGEDVAVVIAEE